MGWNSILLSQRPLCTQELLMQIIIPQKAARIEKSFKLWPFYSLQSFVVLRFWDSQKKLEARGMILQRS